MITQLPFGGEIEPEKGWEKEWQGMPEFIQEDKEPFKKIVINFDSIEDVRKFGELVGQKITVKTKFIWFTKQDREAPKNFIYTEDEDA